jgi:hypothetical protein
VAAQDRLLLGDLVRMSRAGQAGAPGLAPRSVGPAAGRIVR